MTSWNTGPHSHYQPLALRRIQQGPPQPVVLNEIDVFLPNDQADNIEAPVLNQQLVEGN
ncbi:hypothetical protein BG003_010845 [Podila horticola]|nr:hypothetical protein BG003_010845 [Podila horticola]